MSKQTDLLNLTDAITVDSSNNVGIGTSSPTGDGATLHINGSIANSTLHLTNSTTGSGVGDGTYVTTSGNDFLLRNREAGNMLFYTSNTERMRIDSSGRFMVGTTTTHGGNINSATSNSTWGMSVFDAVNNQALIRFLNSGSTQVGSIQHNGSSTSYVTSSDYRLKTDAQPMTGASARVQALNPVNFEWIADGTRVDGFLAHEAQAVVPEAVTGTKDAVDADGNPEYQGIDQSKLVPLLTAALQEALTKIDALETRITALEAV